MRCSKVRCGNAGMTAPLTQRLVSYGVLHNLLASDVGRFTFAQVHDGYFYSVWPGVSVGHLQEFIEAPMRRQTFRCAVHQDDSLGGIFPLDFLRLEPDP